MKIFVHVGLPKCASSAVQGFFRENYEVCASNGICYPVAFREPNGYFSHRPLHNASPDELSSAVASIKDEAIAKGANAIFVSSEELTNSLWDSEMQELLFEQLRASFGKDNVEVVLLIRNVFEYVESVFAQFIRAGMFRVDFSDFFANGNYSLADFLNYFYEKNGFHFFDFYHFVKIYVDILGLEKVHVISTEKSDLEGRDIIEKLCEMFGIPLSECSKQSRTNVKAPLRSLLGMQYAGSIFGQKSTYGKGHLFSDVLVDISGATSRDVQLSGDCFGIVNSVSEENKRFFERNFSGKFLGVFRVPEGFPRPSFDEEKLTDAEKMTVLYIAGTPMPNLQTARNILKHGVPALVEILCNQAVIIENLEARVELIENIFNKEC